MFLACAVILCAQIQVTSSIRTSNRIGQKPNIILIVVDDWGFNDVGFRNRHNVNDIRTPMMDSLAAQGVILDQYYVNMACSPTRSSLLSGRYQIHTGLQHGVIGECQPNALPTDHITVAKALQLEGYQTAMVGTLRRC